MVPAEGSGYYGSRGSYYFTISDSNNMANADVYLTDYGFTAGCMDEDFGIEDIWIYDGFEDEEYYVSPENYTVAYERNVGTDDAPVWQAVADFDGTVPGEYRVAVTGTDPYYGTAYRGFTVYDPYDLQYGYAYFDGSPLYYEWTEDDERIPVFFFAGQAVEPSLSVCQDEWELDSSCYTVTYSNNAKVSADGVYATVTVTGADPYKGTLTQTFKLVDKVDIERYLDYSTCSLQYGNESATYYRYDGDPEFLYTGWAITPSVRFYGGPSGPQLTQGVDYTIAYANAEGAAVAEPTEVGEYRVVVTATPGGKCEGSAEVPFVIASTRDMTDRNSLYPSLKNGDSFSYSSSTRYVYDPSAGRSFRTTVVKMNEVAGSVRDLVWNLRDNGVALTENLDYVVTSTFDSALNMFTYVFTGIGSYEGTVRATVYASASAQDSFNARTVSSYGTVRDAVYGSAVYALLGDDGALAAPTLFLNGLTAGVDYVFDGYVDAKGAALTSASVRDVVYARLVGIGAYAGCERLVEATVAEGASAVSMEGSSVSFAIANGVLASGAEGSQWYLLSSQAPRVALTVYGRSMVFSLDEDNGFTVATTTSGNTMNLAVTAMDGAPISGSFTKTVKLVDKYDLGMVRSVAISDLSGNYRTYNASTGAAVSLEYAGVPYMPQVVYNTGGSALPQATVVLKDASGNVVDAVTGTGSYTLLIQGAGDWEGELAVPLQVSATATNLNLATCNMYVSGDTALVNGAAKPDVTLTCGTYTLKEGVDYTLEYGSNTAKGARAWVKATAVKGGEFYGTCTTNFTVTGEASTTLSKLDYTLYLQLPTGDGFAPATGLRAYALVAGATSGPAVMVRYKDANGKETVLDPSNYTVSYGNVSKPGLGSVTVEGANGYTGALSANFFVVTAPRVDQTITAADAAVKVGKTVQLGATTDGDGALAYASSDESVATVDANGVVTGVSAGKATITITAAETNACNAASKQVTVTVSKAANPIAVTAKNPAAITYSKDKAQAIANPLAVTGAEGEIAYAKAKGDSAFAVNAETGEITAAAGTPAGSYALEITATAAGNGAYEPGAATAQVTVAVDKAPVKVAVPTGKTLTYTGKAQTGVASGDGYTLTGTTKATKAGSYEATATLKTDANYAYAWSDGTTAAKTVSWKINKKAQAITVAKASLSVAMGKTATVSAKTSGDGALTYKSSNAKVVKVNSKTGKLTPVKVGTAKVTVTAAATDGFNKATKTVTVKVTAGTQSSFKFKTPQTVKAKYSDVKKAGKAYAITKATGAKTTVTYAISKYNTSKAKSYLTVNKSTGKVTVKKGTPKGTYKITVKATAKKTSNWKAASKTAVITVKVS